MTKKEMDEFEKNSKPDGKMHETGLIKICPITKITGDVFVHEHPLQGLAQQTGFAIRWNRTKTNPILWDTALFYKDIINPNLGYGYCDCFVETINGRV